MAAGSSSIDDDRTVLALAAAIVSLALGLAAIVVAAVGGHWILLALILMPSWPRSRYIGVRCITRLQEPALAVVAFFAGSPATAALLALAAVASLAGLVTFRRGHPDLFRHVRAVKAEPAEHRLHLLIELAVSAVFAAGVAVALTLAAADGADRRLVAAIAVATLVLAIVSVRHERHRIALGVVEAGDAGLRLRDPAKHLARLQATYPGRDLVDLELSLDSQAPRGAIIVGHHITLTDDAGRRRGGRVVDLVPRILRPGRSSWAMLIPDDPGAWAASKPRRLRLVDEGPYSGRARILRVIPAGSVPTRRTGTATVPGTDTIL